MALSNQLVTQVVAAVAASQARPPTTKVALVAMLSGATQTQVNALNAGDASALLKRVPGGIAVTKAKAAPAAFIAAAAAASTAENARKVAAAAALLAEGN